MTATAKSVRYAITNLTEAAPESANLRRQRFLATLKTWPAAGVDFVQLREKALPPGELLDLAFAGMHLLHQTPAASGRPRLLVNGRPDLALAARADGVHLTSHPGELRPEDIQQLFSDAGLPRPAISASCHTLREVDSACQNGVDLLLFGPIFGKTVQGTSVTAGQGLDALAAAVARAGAVPVLALGGVKEALIPACLAVGAAGIAGIRLFAGEP